MNQKLTTNDAAKILGKSPATIIYYERLGLLKAERTRSGVRLFDSSELERFANARQKSRESANG